MKVHRLFGRSRNCAGGVALEFALVAPLLIAMLLGIVQFSVLFNNISVLTNAASSGALLFSQGRSFTAPYSSAVTAVKGAAGSLVAANLSISASVNGVSCSSDATCLSAFGQGGIPATVTVTYPCPLVLSDSALVWIGIDSSKFCPLSASMTAVVQ